MAEASALDRRVENGRLLVEAAKVALDAETITVGEYIDAVDRSIKAHDQLATLRPLALDAETGARPTPGPSARSPGAQHHR